MKHIFILSILAVLVGCGQQKDLNMSEEKQEKVETVVLVLAEANPEYTKAQILERSRAIDPMVDELDGYYGRKMMFGIENPKLIGDVVYYRDVQSFETASKIEMKSKICQSYFATMLEKSELNKMLVGTPVYLSPKTTQESTIIEVALFKSKPEYTKEQLAEQALAINPVLNTLDGLVSRKLAVTPDGLWMDILYWASLEQANAALPVVMENEICKAFFEMTDDSTSEFMHFEITIDTER